VEWDVVGAAGELLGALAVIATLGYLAIQTRQTRIATEQSVRLGQVQATHAAGDLYARWRTLLLSDPSYGEILVKASEGGDLTTSERNLVSTLFDDLFVSAAFAHQLSLELGSFHKGSVDTGYVLETLNRYPCGIDEWIRFRNIVGGVGPDFVTAIDKELQERSFAD